MLYIIYFAVGVSLSMSSGHHEGGPRSSIDLDRHMRCSASTTRRPSPRIEDGEGVVAPRICLLYVVICYMSRICYMSVICLV
jgi:hypothetical protein